MASPASSTSPSSPTEFVDLPSFSELPPGRRSVSPDRILFKEPTPNVTASDFPLEVVDAIGKRNIAYMARYDMKEPFASVQFEHFTSCRSGMIKGRTPDDKPYLAFVVVRLREMNEYGRVSLYQKELGNTVLNNFAIEQNGISMGDARLNNRALSKENIEAIGEIFSGEHRDLRLVLNFDLHIEEEGKIPIGSEKV